MSLSCEPGDLPRDASPNPQSGSAEGAVMPFEVTPCRCQKFLVLQMGCLLAVTNLPHQLMTFFGKVSNSC